MKRRGWLIWGGAALLGGPTLVVLGAVCAAFLSIRSPGSASGADPIAWVLTGLVVLIASAVMAAAGAGLGWLVTRLLRGR